MARSARTTPSNLSESRSLPDATVDADMLRMAPVQSTAAANQAPVVMIPLADQTFAEDSPVSFTLPANSFSDADGDALTYTATLSNGAALPSWLSFDAASRTFSGTPPLNYNGTTLGQGHRVRWHRRDRDTFNLAIASVNDAPDLS